MLHCILTFRKARIFIIFEGLRFERPHGTFSVMSRVTSWSFFFFSGMSSGNPGFENWMTVQFDTASVKQATTTQRMCEPPRGWIRRRKTGPGTWLGRTAEWENIKSFLSLHFQRNAYHDRYQIAKISLNAYHCKYEISGILPESVSLYTLTGNSIQTLRNVHTHLEKALHQGRSSIGQP